jgi:hypothetical protein
LLLQILCIAFCKIFQQGLVLFEIVAGQVFPPLPGLQHHAVDHVKVGVVVADHFLTWKKREKVLFRNRREEVSRDAHGLP